MERNNDMDRMKRIKSWKAFESTQGKEAIDVLSDILGAIQNVYDLALDSIDNGGSLKVMVTVDNPVSQHGGSEYIFSTSFDSSTRPEDYTFDLNNYDEIQEAIDAAAEPEVICCLTMIDDDDMEVMDIEATYLLEESMDELNKLWSDIYVKTMDPYDYKSNFDYF